jgi:hypothetical protein
MVAHYAGLSIDNPDGVSGVRAHFIFDSELSDTFACGSVFSPGDRDPNPHYLDAFHTLSICGGGFLGGVSEIQGKYTWVTVSDPNDDPTDDSDEPEVYGAYWLTLHELGHSLGLEHGGADEINYKPNYPSYMNYEYDEGLDGVGDTLATANLDVSHGLMPSIDECAVEEREIFAGVGPEVATFLAWYDGGNGWTLEPDGSVDWNENGTVEDAPYELILRVATGDSSSNFPDCSVLFDYDDAARIEAMMAGALASDPALAPMPLHQRTWVLVP